MTQKEIDEFLEKQGKFIENAWGWLCVFVFFSGLATGFVAGFFGFIYF